MRAMLKAQINKTDRNDARGIAQMMRVGLYRPVHVKTLRSQKVRVLLTHRKLLQSKAIGMIRTKFETRIRELVESLPDLAVLVEPLLIVRRVTREQLGILHHRLLLVRSTKWSWLKAWAMQIARHRGMKKAIVALARRMAVIMHRIWVDGTEFRWTREVAAA